jgi:predicted phage terminase large subunit-like protein
MYLLDLWRKRASSDHWVEAFCDLVKDWKPIGWAEEQGQIKAGVGPYLDRRARERQAFVARQVFPTRGDKAVRAQSIRGRMALEGLYVPTSASWLTDFRSELLSFPAGKHDDQVDALGLIGQLLDKMLKGQKPVQPERPTIESGYRAMHLSEKPGDWLSY